MRWGIWRRPLRRVADGTACPIRGHFWHERCSREPIGPPNTQSAVATKGDSMHSIDAAQRQAPFGSVGAAQRWAVRFLVLLVVFAFETTSVYAKGGGIAVTTTATVAGTVVQGEMTITNTTAKSATVTMAKESLEVRYPTGYPVPPLPPGSTSGYFVVATVSLPLPSPIPPLGSVSIPYSIDTCSTAVARYNGAKDMRAAAAVTAGG